VIGAAVAPLEALALAGDWDGFATAFFGGLLSMPTSELDVLRSSADWPSIVADAPASVEDIRALARYCFDLGHFRALAMPVLLQVGSESPANLYVTDALAAVLPDAVVEALAGQAHDAMITAPPEYRDRPARDRARVTFGPGPSLLLLTSGGPVALPNLPPDLRQVPADRLCSGSPWMCPNRPHRAPNLPEIKRSRQHLPLSSRAVPLSRTAAVLTVSGLSP
jgi:hypothetical protein